jgi:hypothetical protein
MNWKFANESILCVEPRCPDHTPGDTRHCCQTKPQGQACRATWSQPHMTLIVRACRRGSCWTSRRSTDLSQCWERMSLCICIDLCIYADSIRHFSACIMPEFKKVWRARRMISKHCIKPDRGQDCELIVQSNKSGYNECIQVSCMFYF